jgi:hypothetical protein
MNNNTKAKRRRMNPRGTEPSISTKKNIKMVITAKGTRHLVLDEKRKPYHREFPPATNR